VGLSDKARLEEKLGAYLFEVVAWLTIVLGSRFVLADRGYLLL
jgi:hypothetical protein